MQQHDFEPLHGYLDSILQFFGGIVASVLLYMGVRYQAKKKITEKNSVQNIIAEERNFHSEIARQIRDNTNRIKAVNRLNQTVRRLFSECRADRFLILIAVNGVLYYRTVSVIYQLHQEDQKDTDAVKRYANLPIDDAYRAMLNAAKKFGGVFVKTEEIKGTILGDIYLEELVVESMVYYIDTMPLDESGKDIMAYVSIATHDLRGFSAAGLNKMRVMINSEIGTYVREIIKNEV